MEELWTNLNQVPETFRKLNGVNLELDQINLIYKTLAETKKRKLPDGRFDPDYKTARELFLADHNKIVIGNKTVFVKKGVN